MNLKPVFLIYAGLLMLVSNTIQAAPAWYWGAGASRVNYTTSSFPDPADPTTNVKADLEVAGVTLKTGVALGNWLGVEIQYGLAKESSTQPFGIGEELEIQQGSAFARFNIPFPKVNLYALAGASVIDIDTGLQSSNEKYVAAGLGLDLMATERSMLYFEGIRYEHEDLESNDPYMIVYTIGYKHHFEFAGFR